jgi:glycosyltransferase involved in cell wall biosynthesis
MIPQSEIRRYYKACDVMVSASNFETLGNTVMESLLCGTPVIVENAGGYKAQVENGRNGYLVDWSNAAEVQKAFDSIRSLGLTDLSPLKSEQSKSVQDIVNGTPGKGLSVLNILRALLFLPILLIYLLIVWLWFMIGNP